MKLSELVIDKSGNSTGMSFAPSFVYVASTSSYIFFISAVFHELIVSIAFNTVSFFAFGGMLVQVVAVLVSEPLRGKQVGNVFFWVTIMLGQPLIVLFYFVDYARQHSVGAPAIIVAA